jgi:xanthine dehydrogenase accessory factor
VREILQQIESWLAGGDRVALATLVRVVKSAPRQPGASMAVNDRGEVIGSVSGGCVESALYDEAMDLFSTGQPRLCRYGIADEQAFAVGLTCGGTIEVFVDRLDWAPQLLPALAEALRANRPVAMVTVVGGAGLGSRLLVAPGEKGAPAPALGTTGSPGLDAAAGAEALAMLRQGATGLRHFGPAGEQRRDDVTLFIESFAPPPRMLVFGAIDFAVAMVRMGKFLGYRVTLCDARPIFATRARFPEADEVVVDWPHAYLQSVTLGPRDAICVLTHDSKFDVPVLAEALKTEAGYIGALGSRRTHERRRLELLEAGVAKADLERISSPIGLDIGGRTPEETAISIAAELIALRAGRPGGRLSAGAEPIHAEPERVGH